MSLDVTEVQLLLVAAGADPTKFRIEVSVSKLVLLWIGKRKVPTRIVSGRRSPAGVASIFLRDLRGVGIAPRPPRVPRAPTVYADPEPVARALHQAHTRAGSWTKVGLILGCSNASYLARVANGKQGITPITWERWSSLLDRASLPGYAETANGESKAGEGHGKGEP